MKNKTKLSSILLASMLIVACGSGGGGASGNTSNNQNNNTPKTEIRPSTPNDIGDDSDGNLVVETPFVAKKIAALTYGLKSLDNVTIEGKNIPLAPLDEFVSSEVINKRSPTSYLSCCSHYENMRYGFIQYPHQDGLNPLYMYYTGPTTGLTMPQEGKATYKGEAFLSGRHEMFAEKGIVKGSSEFDVDFANKQIDGKLTFEQFNPVVIDAKIKGSSFEGTATSKDFAKYTREAEAKVDGWFFGENAKEMGGMYHSDFKGVHTIGWGGVFGAKKQE